MKLWLDDLRSPEFFLRNTRFAHDDWRDWVHVKTAEEAITFLRDGIVSHISLDHDLGSRKGDGYSVAKFIEEQAYLGNIPELRWDVHSANPVGSRRMKEALKNADSYWSKNGKR